MKGGQAMGSMVDEVKRFAEKGGDFTQERVLLRKGVSDIEAMVGLMITDAAGVLQPGKEKNIYKVGQNDERLLMAFGDMMVGYLLLRQAEVAKEKLEAGAKGADKSFYEGKVVTANFFAREVLPRLSSDRKSAGLVNNNIMDLPLESL